MSDRPIIFSASMIRALLDGRKSQTRRILKPQPDYRGGHGSMHDPEEWGWEDECGSHISVLDICPNGFWVGDRLWCREAWSGAYQFRNVPPSQRVSVATPDGPILRDDIWYWADGNPEFGDYERPRPSIHMPRWASRLTLIVTDVRVQRLQEISEADAVAEGIEQARSGRFYNPTMSKSAAAHLGGMFYGPRPAFDVLWNSIHGPEAWDANPWCVALTFETHRCNIDQMGGNYD